MIGIKAVKRCIQKVDTDDVRNAFGRENIAPIASESTPPLCNTGYSDMWPAESAGTCGRG